MSVFAFATALLGILVFLITDEDFKRSFFLSKNMVRLYSNCRAHKVPFHLQTILAMLVNCVELNLKIRGDWQLERVSVTKKDRKFVIQMKVSNKNKFRIMEIPVSSEKYRGEKFNELEARNLVESSLEQIKKLSNDTLEAL